MSNTIEDAIDLFAGNTSAIGIEEGGAIRGKNVASVYGWWHTAMTHHFDGTDYPIGVYPMVNIDRGWQVHWGCIDFDEGE